ncbi:unnamed protein product [Spirodela intermedia]|uniref:Uncharacterized protein n=2 Tax=Spirodela intermedia TaxID=51605 RepID=A0A7I8JGY8_SPIIN|nr:unnamed protein product [Spirodela intermedia]CAA6668672.1 unnamed protein product [Spirodela intermedia]CAA7405557.1 unnamed protein product [Spirodela intermedia]
MRKLESFIQLSIL